MKHFKKEVCDQKNRYFRRNCHCGLDFYVGTEVLAACLSMMANVVLSRTMSSTRKNVAWFRGDIGQMGNS